MKNVKPHILRCRGKGIWFTVKRKSFRGLEKAELLDQCSVYTKTENFGFVLFHLNFKEQGSRGPVSVKSGLNDIEMKI